jgi:outer membrane receptor protein involved in Fe transport
VDAVFDEEDGEYPFARGSLSVGPERIDTIETELRWDGTPELGASIAGSYSRLDREIDKVTPPNEYTNLPGGMNIIGLEATVRSEVKWFKGQVSYAFTHAKYRKTYANPYSERLQYEFPPHMLKGRVGVKPVPDFEFHLSGELYSARPRQAWTQNSGIEDGPAVGLLHFSTRLVNLGGVKGLDLSAGIRNLLNVAYEVGVYRDEVDRSRDGDARYPYGMEMPGRSLNVTLEWMF